MAQVRPAINGPLLTVGARQAPVLRARGGHGRRGPSALHRGSDGHHLNQRVRPVQGGRLPRWQGLPACGSRQVGFEAASILLQWPRPWARRHCDLRVLQTRRDRSCPPRTCGSRCRADPARTSATTKAASSGPVRHGRLRRSGLRDQGSDRPAGHGKVDPRLRAVRGWEAYVVHFCVGPPFKVVVSLLLSCVKRFEKKSSDSEAILSNKPTLSVSEN
jgi:hypothetical protein